MVSPSLINHRPSSSSTVKVISHSAPYQSPQESPFLFLFSVGMPPTRKWSRRLLITQTSFSSWQYISCASVDMVPLFPCQLNIKGLGNLGQPIWIHRTDNGLNLSWMAQNPSHHNSFCRNSVIICIVLNGLIQLLISRMVGKIPSCRFIRNGDQAWGVTLFS